MARLFDDASSQDLTRSGAVVSTEPLTIAAWFNADETTNPLTILSLGNNGATGVLRLALLGNSADGVGAIKQSDAAALGTAETSTAYTANTWNHGAAVFTNDTSRTAYLNGGGKVTNTTNIADPTPDFTSIGSMKRSATTQYMSGMIAEVGVWDIALTDADIAELAAGACPLLVRPESLVAYWPLIGRTSPEIDVVGGAALTLNNAPTTADHPRIYYTASQVTLGVPAAGTTYNESGSGGVVLGGVGTVTGSYAPTAAGGIVLGGVSDLVGSYTPAAAGGLVVGGAGTEAGAYVVSPAGGVVLGGVGTEAGSYAPGTSGGVVLGGVGTDSLGSQYTESGSGGVVLGGVGTVAGSYAPTVAGGLVVGGVATVTADYSPTASGGVVLGGVAEPAASYTITPAGGVVLGGTCTVELTNTVVAILFEGVEVTLPWLEATQATLPWLESAETTLPWLEAVQASAL